MKALQLKGEHRLLRLSQQIIRTETKGATNMTNIAVGPTAAVSWDLGGFLAPSLSLTFCSRVRPPPENFKDLSFVTTSQRAGRQI